MNLDIGTDLPPTTSTPISRMDIAYMAVAMRDPNPVHTEDEFAQQAGLPGVIAHGTFPLGHAGAYLTTTFGPQAVLNYELRLTTPVFPGDQLTTHGSVADRADDHLTIDLTVTKNDGTTAAKGTAKVRT